MNILFLSRWFPYPVDNGSKVRILNLLRILAQNHQVTLLSFNDHPEQPAQVDALKPICAEVISVPWKEYQPTSARAILGLLNPTPRAVIDTFSPEMAQKIHQILSKTLFDVIIASQIEMAAYQSLFGNCPAIFEEVEIGVPFERYTQSQNWRARLRNGLTWFKHKRYLTRLLKNFAICTVASDQEHTLLSETGIRSNDIAVIPNCIDLAEYQPASQKQPAIIFTGSFRYRPNYEAACWFLERVLPLISTQLPDVKFILTGDHLNLQLPSHPNLHLTGHIPDINDLRSLIASASVSVVPLLVGGGTRLKALEAMALRTPLVSTSKGAEGLTARHGEHLLIADTPADFAQAVISILQDQSLREKLIRNGYELVRQQYSTEAVTAQFAQVLARATH